MTKRDITLVAFGAVAGHWVIKLGLAYGVLAFFSAEVPEVPEERTVAEVAEQLALRVAGQLADTEEQIAAVEADIEYIRTEISSNISWAFSKIITPSWDQVERCWGIPMPLNCRNYAPFVSSCRNEPQCNASLDTLIDKRVELQRLEDTKFSLEVEQAQLELDQKLRERE
jgi:hypothetical protein|tara:strand:+ start:344 stop:853 length:510 start_codon:yes stop_codon:yes gene_type:complete